MNFSVEIQKRIPSRQINGKKAALPLPKYGNCCRLLRNRPMWHGYVLNCTTTRKLQPMTEKRGWFWRQNLPSFVQPSQHRNWKTSQDVNGSVQAAQKNGTSPHWTPSSPAGLLFLMASIVFRLYGTKQYTPNNPIHTKNNITQLPFPYHTVHVPVRNGQSAACASGGY